jgi:hypothetical protein
MNTTLARLLPLLFLLPAGSMGQLSPRADSIGVYSVGIELHGGYGLRLNPTNTIPGDYTRGGPTARLRIKWGSHSVVAAGIETGWLSLSSLTANTSDGPFGPTEIVASLDAVPILFVAALQRYNVQLHAGIGFYDVLASSTVYGVTVRSNEWDFGTMLSLGYAMTVGTTFRVGAEIKLDSITEAQVSVLSAGLRIMIPLWEWHHRETDIPR